MISTLCILLYIIHTYRAHSQYSTQRKKFKVMTSLKVFEIINTIHSQLQRKALQELMNTYTTTQFN